MAEWPSVCLSSCTYMSEGFELKLPHLNSLRVWNHGEGKLVLSCPKLSQVWFSHNNSLRIRVEDAVLDNVALTHCKNVLLVVTFRDKWLQSLVDLDVRHSNEVGRRLIEDFSQMHRLCKEIGRQIIEHLGRMQQLRILIYDNFPAACMPRTFPQRLQKIDLQHVDWCCNLPEGLKELCYLEDITFKSDSKPWMFTQQWVELLPMHSLKDVTLGFARFIRLSVRGQTVFQQICSSYG